MFQQYPQSDVNEPIPLHEGRFRVWAGDRCVEGSGSAHLRWLPSPGIEFDIEITEPFPGVGFDSLTVELSGFRTENVVAHSMTLGLTSRIRAFASTMESDRKQNLLSVGFQVVNFTDFITPGLSATPGDPTAIAGVNETERLLGGVSSTDSPTKPVQSLTCAAADLRHDGWHVSLVALPESRDRYSHLQATGGYSFTHVGQLTRIDDSTFAVQQAEKILESLRVFLSFARGAACSLPIRWGRGIDGEIVWRQFGSPIVDRWRQRLSWFDEIHGEVLTELFDAFCQVYNDQRLRESVVRGLSSSIAVPPLQHEFQRQRGIAKLVLGMAALDLPERTRIETSIPYHAVAARALIDVSARTRPPRCGRGSFALCTCLKATLDVPAVIPSRYAALTAFAERSFSRRQVVDSCEALAKLRHGFVHANEKRRNVVSGSAGKAVFCLRRMAVVALVPGTGVAPPVATIAEAPFPTDTLAHRVQGNSSLRGWPPRRSSPYHAGEPPFCSVLG